MNSWLRTGKVALVLALSLSLGGHWALLQTAAWASMLICYTQTDGFCTAVAKTFDAKHPCKLCLAIQKGKSSEKKSDQQKPVGKMDGYLPANHFALRGAAEYPSIVPPHRSFSEWSEPPPKPPPRSA
jgi:hypothetical protein